MLRESFDEVFDTPLTYNYNLTFERELATGWMARAGYVGSTATQGRDDMTLKSRYLYARWANRGILRLAVDSPNTAASISLYRIAAASITPCSFR